MKIATIYTLYGRRAGAELCFEKTVESISKQDSSIEWLIFCNKDAEMQIKGILPSVSTVYIPYLDNQYKKAFWLEFLSCKELKKYDIDSFWIPSGCNHFPGKWDVPVLTTFHDLGEYHVANKYSFARMFFRKKICIPRSVSRSTLYTTVSQFTKRDMLRFLPIKNDELINVVYNGRSPHDVGIPQNSETIISQFNLEKNGYFFTPGRTDYVGKGLDILISAFRSFCKTNSSVKLVLVGPKGEGYDRLEEELKKDNNCNGRVLYLGRVDEDVLVSLYSNCLSTIISSRFEGFGFPVLEAMEYNVPVISSDAGSLPEVAGDGAIIFKSGDEMQLLSAMKEISSKDESQLIELREKGKKRLSLFSWDACAKGMIQCFEKIVNK